jgi:hypothetical protein
VGSVRTDRREYRRTFGHTSGAALVVACIALAAVGVSVARTRSDLRDTRRQLAQSGRHLRLLDADARAAVQQRTDSLAALGRAGALLRKDTAARDRLLEVDRVEYTTLVAAVQSLSQHRDELAADAARARRLDDCLLGASQALNEAAVGDTADLARTLPSAQRRCSAAAP